MYQADAIRKHVYEKHIKLAKDRGEKSVSVLAGDIAIEMDLLERVPNICQALRGEKLAKMYNVGISVKSSAPSGQSTTTIFTYTIL